MKLIAILSIAGLLVAAGCQGDIYRNGAYGEEKIQILVDTTESSAVPAGSVPSGEVLCTTGDCETVALPPDALRPEEGGCWVTGIGHIGSDLNGNGISDKPGAGKANQDSYGGNAMGMKDGSVRGQWQNTTHLDGTKDKFHGQANFLYCWNDGGPGPDVPKAIPNRAIWGGPGKWNHEPGYLFIVSSADYKEGKEKGDADIRDAYAITVYRDVDGDGVSTAADEIVYEESDCVFGNFQIHPPNNGHPYVPSVLTSEMDRISSSQDLCPNANW